MTNFSISGGARTAFHNKGHRDGLAGRDAKFNEHWTPEQREWYREGYRVGKRLATQQEQS